MSLEIPEFWTTCEIGDVAEVIGGGTPPSKDPTNFDIDAGTPWITPADLSGYKQSYISRGSRNLSAKGLATSSAKILPAGSVLFSSRAPIGYVGIAANEVATNQGFKSFILPEGLDSRFVYYYLRHIKPVAEERASGTTFKELSGANAARLPLLIAPTNEQKRIADKLDAVLAQVEACCERLDRVPLILKRFRQAVLAAAVSGGLTEEWREETPIVQHHLEDKDIYLPSTWSIRQIGDVVSLIDGDRGPNYPKASDYRPSGYCVFLSTKNVREFGFLFDELVFISEQKHKTLRQGTLNRDDVVILREARLAM